MFNMHTLYDLLSLFHYMTFLDEDEKNQINESETFIKVSKGNVIAIKNTILIK